VCVCVCVYIYIYIYIKFVALLHYYLAYVYVTLAWRESKPEKRMLNLIEIFKIELGSV